VNSFFHSRTRIRVKLPKIVDATIDIRMNKEKTTTMRDDDDDDGDDDDDDDDDDGVEDFCLAAVAVVALM